MGHIEDRWKRAGRKGTGRRWRARYTDPDGRERSKSFARKVDAERFLTEIEHSKIAGSYLDPDAGRVTLRSRIPLWLDSLTCDATSRHFIAARVNKHIIPALGDKRLDVLTRTPSVIQTWVAGLPVGPTYARQILAELSAIMDQAVADSLIPRNPCKTADIKARRPDKRKLVPWTREQVSAVRAGLPERYQATADCGAWLGLRQGEILGLALSEIDWLRKVVHITHQIRLELGVYQVFSLPKGGKTRDVPLPGPAGLALAAHLERFPAVEVTLPWTTRGGKPRTEQLLFVTPSGKPLRRGAFNADVWTPARRAAGIPDGKDTGMHQLRHHYASVLLRGGVDIKRVSSYLGHASAAFTLTVYSHLMPHDEERSLREIETALAGPKISVPQDSGLRYT